jgi:hypothetical protein
MGLTLKARLGRAARGLTFAADNGLLRWIVP